MLPLSPAVTKAVRRIMAPAPVDRGAGGLRVAAGQAADTLDDTIIARGEDGSIGFAVGDADVGA
jgi:hypothetical protein